jgi:hypothetical protein
VPDLLNRIREELNARVAELLPLVDEHSRLQAAMQVLGDVGLRPPGEAAASSPVKSTKSQKPPPAKRPQRAPRGANRAAVLRAASERPGATSAGLAAVSGVQPNTLSGLLARLVEAGELQTSVLPTGRAGYVLAQTPPVRPDKSAVGSAGADSGDHAAPIRTPT